MELAVCDRRGELPARDRTVLQHRAQDLVAAVERVERPVDRVEDGRRLRQTGEQRRLVECERARSAREVGLRGRLDSVRVVAVVDGVHIRAEDPVLRSVAGELDRQARLLDLALERPLPGDVEVADELLRDRRAALDDSAGAQVLRRGAEDALVVHAAVLVEAAVLDRDGRLGHPAARPGERDRLAVLLGGYRAEESAVVRVDERVRRAPLRTGRDRTQLGEAAARLEGRGTAEARGDDREHDQHERSGDDRSVPSSLLLQLQPALVGPADDDFEVVGAPAPRRAHQKTPAARRRSCARIRSSLSRRSASRGPSAATRTTIVAFPFKAVTTTSGARSSATLSRNRPTTVRRSLSRGTWRVISATFSRLTIVELMIVSEASFSFVITSRAPSPARMKV